MVAAKNPCTGRQGESLWQFPRLGYPKKILAYYNPNTYWTIQNGPRMLGNLPYNRTALSASRSCCKIRNVQLLQGPLSQQRKNRHGSGSAPIINNVKRKWHLYEGSIRGFIGTVTVPGCFGLSADHCVTGVYFGIVVSGEPGSNQPFATGNV